MAQVSPKAFVEKGAQLADDVRIGPFSYIGPQVQIGAGCVIDNNVSVTGRTVIGDKTHVYPLAVIGARPDGREQEASCEIGQANDIREHVTIHGGLTRATRIGNHNLIMIASTVGAGASVGDHGIFDNCSRVGPSSIVEDYVRMSGFACVEEGALVGAYSFVAGFSSISRFAPPFAMLAGQPVRVRGVNVRNLKACGFGETDVQALKTAFRELFDDSGNGLNIRALESLESQDDLNPHVRRLVEAIRQASEAKHG